MIAIVNYGMGNLRSVQKAFEHIGADARVVEDPRALQGARAVVLPGVGAFGKAKENLERAGFVDAIVREIEAGKPFLGICLGLQLLFDESEERFDEREPLPKGFGVIPGRVRRFGPGLKVPQIGWNQIRMSRPSRLYEGIPDGAYVYFVHSYYVDPHDPDWASATTDYGVSFVSSVERDNVMAVQFHPEKSSRVGLQMLRNFAKIAAAS